MSWQEILLDVWTLLVSMRNCSAIGNTNQSIGKGKEDGTATLVHCRVGVSRSATICIAEVMATMDLSFPRA